jgi:hypothetical protein
MKKIILIGVLVTLIGIPVIAQEVEITEVISEEELVKFAKMELLTLKFAESKNVELKKVISNNAAFGGGARYNQIKSAWGNMSKMETISLTPEEKTAYLETLDLKDSLKTLVLDYKVGLIRKEPVLGVSGYEKISKAINEDPTMKERLDAIIKNLKEKEDISNLNQKK